MNLLSPAESLTRVEAYARLHDYRGHDKFDALNSPILETAFGANALTRLLATQLVNRAPLPLRAVFGVRRERNPKGVGNFVRAYASIFRRTGDPTARARALELADWLLANDSRARGSYEGSGRAWGYQFPWQSPGFFAPRHSPNCIVTVFCAEACLAAYALAPEQTKFIAAAREASIYLTRVLPTLESDGDRLCIGYVEKGLKWRVVNINAVVAGFLAKLSRAASSDAPELLDMSRRLVNWVVDAQDSHGPYWNYTSPRGQSGIGPDNYHTGGILDGIRDFLEVAGGSPRIESTYREALDFYAREFFTAEGGPRWRVGRDFPMDVHGAAQGILTFAKAPRPDLAKRIARWAIGELQDSESGRFYYQKHRTFTWKLDLMRWNNSWMMWALAELLERGGG